MSHQSEYCCSKSNTIIFRKRFIFSDKTVSSQGIPITTYLTLLCVHVMVIQGVPDSSATATCLCMWGFSMWPARLATGRTVLPPSTSRASLTSISWQPHLLSGKVINQPHLLSGKVINQPHLMSDKVVSWQPHLLSGKVINQLRSWQVTFISVQVWLCQSCCSITTAFARYWCFVSWFSDQSTLTVHKIRLSRWGRRDVCFGCTVFFVHECSLVNGFIFPVI